MCESEITSCIVRIAIPMMKVGKPIASLVLRLLHSTILIFTLFSLAGLKFSRVWPFSKSSCHHHHIFIFSFHQNHHHYHPLRICWSILVDIFFLLSFAFLYAISPDWGPVFKQKTNLTTALPNPKANSFVFFSDWKGTVVAFFVLYFNISVDY